MSIFFIFVTCYIPSDHRTLMLFSDNRKAVNFICSSLRFSTTYSYKQESSRLPRAFLLSCAGIDEIVEISTMQRKANTLQYVFVITLFSFVYAIYCCFILTVQSYDYFLDWQKNLFPWQRKLPYDVVGKLCVLAEVYWTCQLKKVFFSNTLKTENLRRREKDADGRHTANI